MNRAMPCQYIYIYCYESKRFPTPHLHTFGQDGSRHFRQPARRASRDLFKTPCHAPKRLAVNVCGVQGKEAQLVALLRAAFSSNARRDLLSFRANERHEHSAKTLLGDSDLTGRKGSPSSHSCTGLSE